MRLRATEEIEMDQLCEIGMQRYCQIFGESRPNPYILEIDDETVMQVICDGCYAELCDDI